MNKITISYKSTSLLIEELKKQENIQIKFFIKSGKDLQIKKSMQRIYVQMNGF